MSDSANETTAWHQSIEVIEAGYEFMLAYAAQGLEANQSGAHEAELRSHMDQMRNALTQVHAQATARSNATDAANMGAYASFLDALQHDAMHALGAIQLVSTRTGISSQLIDNLNASSHIRALLTDLFLLDEALKHD